MKLEDKAICPFLRAPILCVLLKVISVSAP